MQIILWYAQYYEAVLLCHFNQTAHSKFRWNYLLDIHIRNENKNIHTHHMGRPTKFTYHRFVHWQFFFSSFISHSFRLFFLNWKRCMHYFMHMAMCRHRWQLTRINRGQASISNDCCCCACPVVPKGLQSLLIQWPHKSTEIRTFAST